ncbi:short chain dehydrogenase [Nakaseomyces glabratus]|nr:short chain dehydrogenase [Nakaseomyces glabratus]
MFCLEDQVVLIAGGSQGLGKQFGQKYWDESRHSKIILVSRSDVKLRNAITDITGGRQEPVELVMPEVSASEPSASGSSAINLSKSSNHAGFESELRSNSNRSSSSLKESTNVVTHLTTNAADSRIVYIACDLSDPDAVERMFVTLQHNNLLPTQVLACAGGSIPKLFTDLTAKELEMGVKMNYMTTLFVIHKAAQMLPQAHLILFSSSTAFFPFIGYSQYAPAKVSLKALTSILRHELPNTRISCVYPGNFYSEGYVLEEMSKPDITKSIEGSSYPISCEECCDKIVWWLNRGYDDVTTDSIGWFLMSLDMGLNKHNNNSAYWFVQWLIGVIANLLVVPFYMVLCSYQINKWHKQNKNKNTLL